jgi:hypothetical protein
MSRNCRCDSSTYWVPRRIFSCKEEEGNRRLENIVDEVTVDRVKVTGF